MKIKIEAVDNKIPNTIGLVKETDYNTNIKEIENEIPDTRGLILIQRSQNLKMNYLMLMI